ncbi:MAG: sodium:proton antiporter [Patescibacteria group bacterium]|nr:sodium:proton antiporter [Patescibacteria group bacterium]MDE2438630.1 sodium:proton antiporter [Patescibacteria group bacterium]
MFETAAILLTAAAIFSYINVKYLRLSDSVGLTILSMAFSFLLVIWGRLGFEHIQSQALAFVSGINFSQTFLVGMLGYLLFAGALQIDVNELWDNRFEIGVFSTFGVLASTLLVGLFTHSVLRGLGIEMSLVYCFLFGALISPTDPILVLAVLKSVGARRGLQAKIAGEALFNDGVGIVVFLLIAGIAQGGSISLGSATGLFLAESLGGFVLGFLAGYIGLHFLNQVANYKVEVLITLALVTSGYALASWLHISGAIAMITAGLLIGNRGRFFAMSDEARHNLRNFWDLIDDMLNSLLFVIIGLELVVIPISAQYALAGACAIAVVLAARWMSIAFPVSLFRIAGRAVGEGTTRIMTWGGLRGGIPVALALSLQATPERNLILTMTYIVVAFSIIVQGSTIRRFVASIYQHTPLS